MFSILLVVQILVSISIIALVMLQQGKGADMGAGFGAGASGTVFGSRGSGSFFTRATGILAAVFFINCLLIASPLIRDRGEPANVLADQIEEQARQQQEAEQTNAAIEALDKQQAENQDSPGEGAGADVPDITLEAPVPPALEDLPE